MIVFLCLLQIFSQYQLFFFQIQIQKSLENIDPEKKFRP